MHPVRMADGPMHTAVRRLIAYQAAVDAYRATLPFTTEADYYPMRKSGKGSFNVGPCKALRDARTARGLHPITGTRSAVCVHFELDTGSIGQMEFTSDAYAAAWVERMLDRYPRATFLSTDA